MTEEQEERLVKAFEDIANCTARWVDSVYPVKQLGREAVVTHIPTEEDLAKQEQGFSEEPIEEWIGLREKEFVEKESAGRNKSAEDVAPDLPGTPWD